MQVIREGGHDSAVENSENKGCGFWLGRQAQARLHTHISLRVLQI